MDKITIIMKPTLECNSNCKYCYFKDIRTSEKMSIITFKNLINKLNNYNKIFFIWHGGEPLLMGLNFFEEIVKIQENSKLEIKNEIQTNLTLLNSSWINFFKENHFTISTSLDGVKEVHNTNRKDFDLIIDNIKVLTENNFNVGIVSIVGSHTIPYLYENFKLFEDLHLSGRINPETCTTTNKNAITTNSKIYEFTIKFYHDLWLGTHDEKFHLAPACEILDFINSGKNPVCVFDKKSCVGRFPTILWNGDVIHCGRFVGTEHGHLGNVNDSNFSFGLDNLNILKYHNIDLERIKKCEPCEYYNLCHGGCFHHALILGNGKDPFCEAYKGIFEHILVRKKQLCL